MYNLSAKYIRVRRKRRRRKVFIKIIIKGRWRRKFKGKPRTVADSSVVKRNSFA